MACLAGFDVEFYLQNTVAATITLHQSSYFIGTFLSDVHVTCAVGSALQLNNNGFHAEVGWLEWRMILFLKSLLPCLLAMQSG